VARALPLRSAAALALLASSCATSPAPPGGAPRYIPSLELESVGPVRVGEGALYGRVLLVNFMATWCFPCVQELPALVELQRRYGGRDFTVVLVGMDLEGAQVLEPFARYYELPFPLLVAGDAIRGGQSPFGPLEALPTSFLIGKDGELLAGIRGVPPVEDLRRHVEAALHP